MAKPALGRGLGALLGESAPAPGTPPDAPAAGGGDRVEKVALGRIARSPLQPRRDFPPESLQELADSIREQGILQPLVVRRRGEHFELIAGERRWRAAQSAGLSEVPVMVREADDPTVLELMLIENLQRENLNPIEEALGYHELIEQFRLTQDQAAVKVGRSRAAVANALRLLRLAPELQEHVRTGRLSVGHAKAILALPGPEQQQWAAVRVLQGGLSVRETEALVADLLERAAAPRGIPVATKPARDIHVADLENRLQERFATRVSLRYRNGKGAIEVRFHSDDDLERILQLLGVGPER